MLQLQLHIADHPWELLPPKLSIALFLFSTLSLPLTIIVLLTNTTRAILHDYHAFISLGPGGTPSSPYGYLRIKFLSIFALRDPFTPAPVPSHFKQRSGVLIKLPRRAGERPNVRGIAPHRQTDQYAPSGIFNILRTNIAALANAHPKVLISKTSCFEKHGPGLFARTARNLTPHCNGEVCHAHPSDGSLHLTLHPADAAIVLRAGWGERHPLGSGGWLSRFVPGGFVMVYAPRTEEEVAVVMQIVTAAVWWVGGVTLEAGEGVGADREIDGLGNDTWAACPEPKQAILMS
ncbi:hypothetical protein BT63DRAFT_480283 [Microthyrium microscopicum]|uniref:Luciferase domain-containing protein n=1 Tax=Microthyrium microscopicum TaxID=703497 RepID=A0A6A6U778_9PEZI|nr:hypothetical protein BT63DRAFT_480283 [Microthyrium microscopicum]